MVKVAGPASGSLVGAVAGAWDEQKVALLEKAAQLGGADAFTTEEVSYLKGVVTSPDTEFAGEAKQKLLGILVERLKVDPAEVGLSELPAPVHLQFTSGTSNKFYRLELTDPLTLSIDYGKIGTKGQTQVKTFPTRAAALKEYEKKLAEKTKEGYLPVAPVESEAVVQVKSFADWVALTPEQREEIVDDLEYWPERWPQIKSTGEVPLEELKKPEYRAFADKMIAEVGDLEVDSDYHATIGPPEIKVTILTLPTGEILGGKLDYYQEGCDNDGDGGHFDTREEAEAAGGELSDVNWQAHAKLDHDLQPLGDLPYVLEWSGY